MSVKWEDDEYLYQRIVICIYNAHIHRGRKQISVVVKGRTKGAGEQLLIGAGLG